MRRLEGKRAIVTGAASGIGRAIAEAYAEEGAFVWIADRSEDGAEAAAIGMGPAARALLLDVTDRESINAAVAWASVNGGVDILVNAAGVYDVEPWLKITEDSFDRIFAVNARGLAFMSQAVAQVMVDAGSRGVIVNIASVGGRRGDPSVVAYTASKAAVISLTQSAARSLAPHGIRVNCIAPGPVRTAMYDQVLKLRSERLGQTPEQVDRLLVDHVPLGRSCDPSEQAGAAIFLASEESSYVTGQTLNVDGGMFMN